MDKRSAISQTNESGNHSFESVDKQTMDAIGSVASKLRNIGDNLNQSYKQPPVSKMRQANAAPFAVWEGCLDICVLVVKATS